METTRVECVQPASLRHPATFPNLQRAISLQEAVTVTSWTVCVYVYWCTMKQRGIISPACHKPKHLRTAATVSNSMRPPSSVQRTSVGAAAAFSNRLQRGLQCPRHDLAIAVNRNVLHSHHWGKLPHKYFFLARKMVLENNHAVKAL